MLKPTLRIQRLLFSIILFLSLFEPAMAVTVGEPAPNIFGRTLDDKLFRLSDIKNSVINILVYDGTAKLIMEKSTSTANEMIDISKLARGIYFIEVKENCKVIYRSKMVKQ